VAGACATATGSSVPAFAALRGVRAIIAAANAVRSTAAALVPATIRQSMPGQFGRTVVAGLGLMIGWRGARSTEGAKQVFRARTGARDFALGNDFALGTRSADNVGVLQIGQQLGLSRN
jgi:hypothetical protein